MSPGLIDVVAHDGTPLPVDGARLAETLSELLRAEGAEGAVSCVLADDPTLGRLNRDYRGIDGPTDVLSFVLADGDGAFPGDVMLGEIYISVSRAEAQAREAGRDVAEEIAHLAVHGALHLSGHEHDTDEGHARMLAAEERSLRHWRSRAAPEEAGGRPVRRTSRARRRPPTEGV